MKKALVLGASGGMGLALVYELVTRGMEVVAFSRGEEKLNRLYRDAAGVSIVAGDVLSEEDLSKACEGVDVIFHAVSFPYEEWPDTHIPCIENILQVAKARNVKVALVDNIYAYGRQSQGPVSEEAEKAPHTKKGNIRLEMENMLKASEVPALIVHMPDLYGPNAENTILHETLKNAVQNKTANYVGDPSLKREFLYTFDGAKAMVELALREDAYNQNWNVPGAELASGNEILEMLREITGFSKSMRTVTRGMIRFIGIFQPFMKELVEMLYLTEEPVHLSGGKYERELGPLPKTGLKDGLTETIAWMKEPNPHKYFSKKNSKVVPLHR